MNTTQVKHLKQEKYLHCMVGQQMVYYIIIIQLSQQTFLTKAQIAYTTLAIDIIGIVILHHCLGQDYRMSARMNAHIN